MSTFNMEIWDPGLLANTQRQKLKAKPIDAYMS